ncbi:MAG: T9SS type A sorting domain-containing protein [Haliscomenobacter sp.]|nr:T9SS type A sorting domain-containing protein [Haliscomenobacter sp.]
MYFDFVAPAKEITQIRIFNTLGQPVFHQSIHPSVEEIRTDEVDVKSWPPGAYYVQLLRGKEVMVKMVQVF